MAHYLFDFVKAHMDTPADAERADAEPTWPHYFSTYCIHEAHEDCRLTCKHCQARCRCECHDERP